MQRSISVSRIGVPLLGIALMVGGCGLDASVFNPAFVNTAQGGVVPVTPGPAAAFVMVRCLNETFQPVEFIVTIERSIPVRDENGNVQVGDDGDFVTRPERKTVRLTTAATGQARELGTLFSCGTTPVTTVGLGEGLLPTDAAVFVGGQGAAGAAGFGVPAGNLNPLELAVGNFNCGDTIIYRAFVSSQVAGGVALQVLLLPGSEQPSEFQGPSTFSNLADFLSAQTATGDQP